MSSQKDLVAVESPAETPKQNGWIGVDLDGTLAHYDGWKGVEHIGEPVPVMVRRVHNLISEGWTVKIVTARGADIENHTIIHAWLLKHGLPILEVTDRKDFMMKWLWDDRAIAVMSNTGISHLDQFQLMREDVDRLAKALGVTRKQPNFHETVLRITEELQELEAVASGALDMLDYVKGDNFKGGSFSQAFKDVTAARAPLRAFVKGLQQFKKVKPDAV
jgi:hypothetical protein